MEVHAHSHTARKKWTHYFWEFLMLFLAVFCGFMAENIREHQIEHQREKKFMQNLVDDLKQDTTAFTQSIKTLSQHLEKDDSLVQLLNSPEVKNHGSALYFLGRHSSRSSHLALHDATIQQLKNSGGFRLIRKEEVSKKIMEYYNKLVFIKYLQDVELLESQDYRKLAIDVFHPIIFNSIVSPADNSISRPSGNPALLTYDTKTLIRISGMVSYHKNTKFALSKAQNDMKEAAIELISFIQKEYPLK